MALIDRFTSFNNINLNNFYKLIINNYHVGYVNSQHATQLVEYLPNIFVINEYLTLNHQYNNANFEELSDLFDEVAKVLLDKYLISSIKEEYLVVNPINNSNILFKLDRNLFPFLGIQARGVHLNGYVLKKDEPYIWVAKRAKDKLVYPGKLDNIVAGAIPYGLGANTTVIKEANEEASIDKNLASQSVLVNCFSYMFAYKTGIRNDVIFEFDLKMPETFVPFPNDGEVEKFELIKAVDVLDILSNTDDFKFNSGIVVINFLRRLGVIKDTDYPEVVQFFSNNKVSLI
ncbi:DUF4743 domain-containing protein [Rickettsiales bacterium LUAb2]